MKTSKILLQGALMTALLVLASCKNDSDEKDIAALASVSSDSPSFVADAAGGSVNFSTSGGQVLINVDCGTDWEAVNNGTSWLEADYNVDKGTLTLTAGQNTEAVENTATVTLRTSASRIVFATINATQDAYGAPEISLESTEWYVQAGVGLTTTIAVDATEEWTVAEVSDEWLAAEKTDEGLQLTAEANIVEEERTATVTVSCTDGITTASATVTVTQAAYGAPEISLGTDEVHFQASGDLTATISVDASEEWTIAEVTGDWIAAEKTDDGLLLTAEDNTVEEERTATVTVSCTDGVQTASATVTVTQDPYGAPTISVETAEWHVAANGELTTTIAVESSEEEWTVAEVTEDWLTAEKVDESLYLTAKENTESEEREATVTVSCTDGVTTATATVTVTQDAYNAPTISVETEEWHAPAKGTLATTIAVEASEEEWTVTNECEWLTVEATTDGVSVTAAANEATDERTGEFSVSCTDGVTTATATVTVTQDGVAYITLGDETVAFTAAGGTSTVTVESNYDPAVSYDETVTWLTVTCEDGVLTVTAAANEKEEDLEAVVTLTAGDGAENTAEAQITVTVEAAVATDTSAMILLYTTTGSNTIQLPINTINGIAVDCTVDWGDGTVETITSALPRHAYSSAGDWEVTISGTVPALGILEQSSTTNYTGITNYITGVKQWGKTGLQSCKRAFFYCKNFTTLPETTGDAFEDVTDFSNAFQSCSTLVSVPYDLLAKVDKLTSLNHAFYDCMKLESIPSGFLDGCTNVTDFTDCFFDCASLTEIPSGLLDKCTSATSLNGLFYKCSSLKSIPSGLFDNCTAVTDFSYVFDGCETLRTIPDGLFDNCTAATTFDYAFDASGLTTAPSNLFAKCSNATSFKRLFYECPNLATVPSDLFSGCTAATTMEYAFAGCTNLTTVPSGLFADCSSVTTFNRVFYQSTGLTSIPAGVFSGATSATDFGYCFYGCTGLTSIPLDVFSGCTAATDLSYCFDGSGLTSVPDNVFKGLATVTTFASAFRACSSLETIGNDLFSGCSAATTFTRAFQDCTSLTTISAGAFSGCTAATDFDYVFYGCTALTTIPEGLFKDMTTVTTFYYAFRGCTGLTTIGDSVFSGCAAATNFGYSFYGCTALTSIPENLFADSKAAATFSDTFYNCTSLTGESAYDVIEVDGVSTKVHLYERADHSDYYGVSSYTKTSCYQNCTGLSDHEAFYNAKWCTCKP